MKHSLEEQLTGLERQRESGAITDAMYRTRREQIILLRPLIETGSRKKRMLVVAGTLALVVVVGLSGYLFYRSRWGGGGSEVVVTIEATSGASFRGYIASDVALTEFSDSRDGKYRSPVSTGPRPDFAVVQKTNADGEIRYSVLCAGKTSSGRLTGEGEFRQVTCR